MVRKNFVTVWLEIGVEGWRGLLGREETMHCGQRESEDSGMWEGEGMHE